MADRLMAKKILLTGPESSGKSTAYDLLLQHLTEVVGYPEYARSFLTPGYSYTYQDVLTIAHEQSIERESVAHSTAWMVLDTEWLVLQIWLEERFSSCPAWIYKAWLRAEYDHIFLCKPDFAWVEDPLREHPQGRERLFARYQNRLDQSQKPYQILEGNPEQRIRFLKNILNI